MNLLCHHSKAVPFRGSFLLFMFDVCLYYTVLPVLCSLLTTYWEIADLLALLCVMFPCVLSLSHMVTKCKVWYLIVSIPALFLLLNNFCSKI